MARLLAAFAVLLAFAARIAHGAPAAPAPATVAASYVARLTGNPAGLVVPRLKTSAKGEVALDIRNATFAQGFAIFYNVGGAYMAHAHADAAGANVTAAGAPVAWLWNSTLSGSWQPFDITDEISFAFTFNPSINNVTGLLKAGKVFVDLHTSKNKGGEIWGRFEEAPSDYSRRMK